MVGQQEGNQEPEHELGRLEPRPAELPPFIESPEAETHMNEKRAVKEDRAGGRLPQKLLEDEATFHRLDGNIAERMVGEVQPNVSEQHEPAREPNPADAEPGGASRRLGRWPYLFDLRHRVSPNHVELLST